MQVDNMEEWFYIYNLFQWQNLNLFPPNLRRRTRDFFFQKVTYHPNVHTIALFLWFNSHYVTSNPFNLDRINLVYGDPNCFWRPSNWQFILGWTQMQQTAGQVISITMIFLFSPLFAVCITITCLMVLGYIYSSNI